MEQIIPEKKNLICPRKILTTLKNDPCQQYGHIPVSTLMVFITHSADKV